MSVVSRKQESQARKEALLREIQDRVQAGYRKD
jgi:hypothetical protein